MINHINKTGQPGIINGEDNSQESSLVEITLGDVSDDPADDAQPGHRESALVDQQEEISESEEMYIITIARLAERGIKEPVPISLLAKELSIQPVSANQMVHKLAEEGYLDYIPYKGVRLTTSGRKVARQVLRHRRLWEVFLVDHLDISLEEADALACRLEHITPTSVVNSLDQFLEFPRQSPQGWPIPELEEEGEHKIFISLNELPVGRRSEVVRIESDPTTVTFLDSIGLRLGQNVSVLAVDTRGTMLLKVGETMIQLASDLTSSVFVR